ncbi:IS30 family transposase [Frankia sp. CcI49]|uniref:IS30 family transposase n=1 Tax=Frankia sp. CcI49 TaxID=1745382 RepID=UPI00321FC14B
MAQGVSNSAACREVGINRRTGTRWRYGRTSTDHAGRTRSYPPITQQPRVLSTRFLSEDERVRIADLLRAGNSMREIARQLDRDPATISREIRRNRDPRSGVYHPHQAEQRAAVRRSRSTQGKLRRNPALRQFVQQRLDQHWSPEQISVALRHEFTDDPEMRAAPETIYQALYRPERGGLDRDAATKLRTRRRARRPRRRLDQRATRFIDPGTLITQRPAEVQDRIQPGHWEGDLIVGQGNRSAIATLVERSTRFVMLLHLPDRHGADQVLDALVRRISSLPSPLVRSLTWDQGSEMSRHDEFTAATGVPVYFCEAAKPWQRGSNENTNGLLRQYFPKGTDLSIHTAADLAAVATEINTRPRKILGWTTPASQLDKLVATLDLPDVATIG